MNPEVRAAIDRLISHVGESGNRLEDCLIEDSDVLDRPEPKGEDGPSEGFGPEGHEPIWKNPCVNGASGRSLFNCFPSSRRTVCHKVKFILLPRSPKVGSMGLEESAEFGQEYFTGAIDSLLHWASECRGRYLVIMTDTWPLPGKLGPCPQPRPWQDPFEYYRRRRIRFDRHRLLLPSSAGLHSLIGRILEVYNIRCEVHLFTSRGKVTQLPDPDFRDWPPGW